MGSRYMGYPSPRGVHVPDTYANSDDNDPYRRDSIHSPRRNRYSRSVHQTPRARDVTWISSPDPTSQSFHVPSTPRAPPPRAPSSPAYRPPTVVPPSPTPTVGEHMAVDDDMLPQDGNVDPYTYQPQRRGGGGGFIQSLWRGLKKLSGFRPTPYNPRSSWYENQTVEMPVPRLSSPNEVSQYGNPTPPGTDEQHGTTPYTSPYVRPTNLGATPAVTPGSLRASPVPMPSVEAPPAIPITVVSPSISPSIPPSPIPSMTRSPAMGMPQNLSARMPEPVAPPIEDGSQTLHEPVPGFIRPPPLSVFAPLADGPKFPIGDEPFIPRTPSSSGGSMCSTMARFRRFFTNLDDLPWVSETQIANEYVPERTPRSQMRKRVRQGAEPSWYNARPEVVERPEYWSEWDMWAKQSTAALWDGVGGRAVGWDGAGGPGQWGVMYPHGYAPVQPRFVYPSGYPPPGVVNDRAYSPVIPG